MSTSSWTVAPAGYLEPGVRGARLFDGVGAGRTVPPLAPATGSGLPAVGGGVPMCAAAPLGLPTTGTRTRTTDVVHTGVVIAFDGTTLGIPSSRRTSS